MSRLVSSVILIAVFIVVANAQASPITAQASFETQVVTLVNQHRAAIGRAALGTDVRLFAASEGHSSWMCTNQILSHSGSGGSTPGRRATAAGYPWFAVGETVAQGFTTPAAVVAGFKGSAPHWNILMSASYRDIGAGYVACDGRVRRHYWTLMVGNSRSPATPVSGGAGTTLPTATPEAQPAPTQTPVASTGGAVSGAVRLQGRVPWAGTTILIDGVPRATTSSTGAFLVSGIAGGTHTVTARRVGMLDSARSFSVSGGTLALGTTTLRAGDLNGDNGVQYDDFSSLFGRWGSCTGQPLYLALADFDVDRCNGYGDYAIMYYNYRLVGPTAWR